MIRVHVQTKSSIVQAGLEALLREGGEFDVVGPERAHVVVTDGEPDPDAAAVVVLADRARPLSGGVKALLPLHARAPEIAAAVQAAAAGLIALHPQFFDSLSEPVGFSTGPDEPLTPREMEVLNLLAEGVANKEIAYRLGISEHTVKFHVAGVLDKLHAGTRTEAVSIGIRAGLVLL